MSFLRVKPSIQGLVLAEFDDGFINPYFGSRFDNGSTVNADGIALSGSSAGSSGASAGRGRACSFEGMSGGAVRQSERCSRCSRMAVARCFGRSGSTAGSGGALASWRRASSCEGKCGAVVRPARCAVVSRSELQPHSTQRSCQQLHSMLAYVASCGLCLRLCHITPLPGQHHRAECCLQTQTILWPWSAAVCALTHSLSGQHHRALLCTLQAAAACCIPSPNTCYDLVFG